MAEYEAHIKEYEDEEPFGAAEDTPPEEPSVLRRVVVAVVAFIVLLGLVWTYQVRPFFLFRTTPSVPVEQIPPPGDLQSKVLSITVPLKIVIVRGGEITGSGRDVDNVTQLTKNAEAVWNQAGVVFNVRTIEERIMTDQEIDRMFDTPVVFWDALRVPEERAVTVVLVRTLRGSNGIAWPGHGGFAVADVTTVPDYRAYAHELGHILGLEHTEDSKNRLLYRGANGTVLTTQEIETARAAVVLFFGD